MTTVATNMLNPIIPTLLRKNAIRARIVIIKRIAMTTATIATRKPTVLAKIRTNSDCGKLASPKSSFSPTSMSLQSFSSSCSQSYVPHSCEVDNMSPISYPSFLRRRRLDCPEIRQSTKSTVAFDDLVDGSCLDLFDDLVDGSCCLLNCTQFSPVTLFSSFEFARRTVTKKSDQCGREEDIGPQKDWHTVV